MDEIGKVNQFPQSLYRQHQKYLDEHQEPPEHKTFDLHEVTRIEVDGLPEGVRVDANGRVVTDDPALSEKLHFGGVRGGLGFLSFHGRMSDDERQKLAALPKPTLDDYRSACDQQTVDLVASFQRAMVDDMVEKTLAAAREHDIATLFVTGGVAANNELRRTFEQRAAHEGLPVFFPSRPLSTDNAAMIAAAAYPKFLAGDFAGRELSAEASLPLKGTR